MKYDSMKLKKNILNFKEGNIQWGPMERITDYNGRKDNIHR